MISNIGDLSKFKRYDAINHLIYKRNYTSYLEVGTSDFLNFNKIVCSVKECIDPCPQVYGNYTYNMPSDDAFVEIKKQNKKYDIIFIDGLHWSTQVTKDIKNSLDVLNDGGMILLHDCDPPSTMHARYPPPNPINGPWNGDCYKSIIEYRFKNPKMFVCVIDTDWGIGIIDPFKESSSTLEEIPKDLIQNDNDDLVGGTINLGEKIITWDYFDKNRQSLLNMITLDEFLNVY